MPCLRTGTERRQSRSYAVRFAAGCDGVFMTLSGMSDLAQINDSLSYMKEFRPLDEKELEAVRNVCRVLHTMKVIPCTSAALSGISAFPPIPRRSRTRFLTPA